MLSQISIRLLVCVQQERAFGFIMTDVVDEALEVSSPSADAGEGWKRPFEPRDSESQHRSDRSNPAPIEFTAGNFKT